jgi:peroxiredoxin
MRYRYRDREKYENLLKNLESLWSEKSVTEENYIKLTNEYTGNLRKAKRDIANIKAKVTGRIKAYEKHISEINSEIELIGTRYKIGDYFKDELDKQTLSGITQKQSFESAIKVLKDIHNAKSSKNIEDLPAIVKRPDIQEPPISDKPSAEYVPPLVQEPFPIQEPVIKEPESTQAPFAYRDRPSERYFIEKPIDVEEKSATKDRTDSSSCWSTIIFILIALTIVGLIIWGLIAGIGAIVTAIQTQLSQPQRSPTLVEPSLPPLEKTPPQISEIQISNISLESITLSWTTDKETISCIDYFEGNIAKSGAACLGKRSTLHSVKLHSLIDGYYDNIKIISTDNYDNTASAVVTIPACINIGCRAPDFTAISTSNENITLSTVNSKMILLHFWLSDCGPCVSELPLIQRLYDERSHNEIEILAVNVRGGRNSVTGFLTEHGYTFNVLLDAEGKVDDLYRNQGFPTTFLLDGNKVIIKKHSGAFENDIEINDFIVQ